MFSNNLSPSSNTTESYIFSFRLNSLAVMVLSVSACLVYWPTFFNDFQGFWDDQWMVKNHYTEGGLTSDNLKAILTEFYTGQYSPLNQLHYTILYTLVGYDPFWFHAVGLAMHIANALLAYFFIARLLTRSTDFTTAAVVRISMLTALLLAVHPFLVETVAWISASKFLIYTLFYLLALHAYLRFLNNRSAITYLLCILCFILSFGGKEQAVTFPVCALLLDYVLGRKFTQKEVWLEKIPFLLLAFLMGLAAMAAEAESGYGMLSNDVEYPFYQRLLFGCYALTEYVVKCLVPVKLSYMYLFPNGIGQDIPLRFWIYPFIVIAAAIALGRFWKNRWLLFGIGFFAISIAMVIHVIPLSRNSIVADRYMYLPAVGFFFIIAYFIDWLVIHKEQYWKFTAAFVLLYIVALGAYAHERTRVWRTTDSLKKEIKALEKKHGHEHPTDSVNVFHQKSHP